MSAGITTSPVASESQTCGGSGEVPVRRTLTVDDMPADKDYDEDTKTAIARVQIEHIREFSACFCAKCRIHTRVTMAYKCRWCGVWYCHRCAATHFGPDTPTHRSPAAVREREP